MKPRAIYLLFTVTLAILVFLLASGRSSAVEDEVSGKQKVTFLQERDSPEDALRLPEGTASEVRAIMETMRHERTAAMTLQATDIDPLTKSVNRSSAKPGDVLQYALAVRNPAMSPSAAVLSDALPQGIEYIAGSVSGGLQYNSSERRMTWSGTIPASELSLTPVVGSGYVSMRGLGDSPEDCPPSDCDDGGWAFGFNDASFSYLGKTYQEFIWSVNGTLEYGVDSGSSTGPANLPIPDSETPNNLLAPWWTDLNLSAGGAWFRDFVSDGTNSYYVLEWENVPHYQDNSLLATFQIWMVPGTDLVWFVYERIDGNTATVGFEDEHGTAGDMLYFNGAGTKPATPSEYGMIAQDIGSKTFAFDARITAQGGSTIHNEAVLETLGWTYSDFVSTAVEAEACYPLSREHEGSGGNPTASPPNSDGCSQDQFHAGESIAVQAAPDSGWVVDRWSGTANDASSSKTNSVTMPPAGHTVKVFYRQSEAKVYLPSLLTPADDYFEGPREKEPNNNYLAANGPLRFNKTYLGYPNDNWDWFSVQLDSMSDLSVELDNHNNSGTQLQVWSMPAGDPLRYDAEPPYRITYEDAAPGEYFIAIFTAEDYHTSKSYELHIRK